MRIKKTLSHARGRLIDDRLLLDYLEGAMPYEQQRELEELLDEDPFLNDAIEGLSELKNKDQLKAIAEQINHKLRRRINLRRKERRQRRVFQGQWGWIFTFILVLLILVCWVVYRVAIR